MRVNSVSVKSFGDRKFPRDRKNPAGPKLVPNWSRGTKTGPRDQNGPEPKRVWSRGTGTKIWRDHFSQKVRATWSHFTPKWSRSVRLSVTFSDFPGHSDEGPNMKWSCRTKSGPAVTFGSGPSGGTIRGEIQCTIIRHALRRVSCYGEDLSVTLISIGVTSPRGFLVSESFVDARNHLRTVLDDCKSIDEDEKVRALIDQKLTR